MTDIKNAQVKGKKRLNSREPQFPPDSYFIRRNAKYLTECLKDERIYKHNASPELKRR
jgi:hypothetical protein